MKYYVYVIFFFYEVQLFLIWYTSSYVVVQYKWKNDWFYLVYVIQKSKEFNQVAFLMSH